jgi:perosamine synthetase
VLWLWSRIQGQHVGTFGDFGAYSFYPVKHITTLEGGMLMTQDDATADRVKKKRGIGVDRSVLERSVPGQYDVTYLGLNFRMNELQAAIGVEQLKKSKMFHEKRERNYQTLERLMKPLDEIHLFQSSGDGFLSSYYCFSVILNDRLTTKRLEMIQYLNSKGIGTSIYYPMPVPHFTYYQNKYGTKLGNKQTSFPNAAKISYSSIALSVGPHLDETDMETIARTFKDAVSHVKR